MKQPVASGILIDPLGRILLIKRKYNKKDLPNYWSFPGGKMETGETIEQTVIREVKEEVGLDFVVKSLYIQGEGENSIFYRFLGSFSGDIVIQEEECDGYGWFHYAELEQLLLYARIKDALSMLKNDGLLI